MHGDYREASHLPFTWDGKAIAACSRRRRNESQGEGFSVLWDCLRGWEDPKGVSGALAGVSQWTERQSVD